MQLVRARRATSLAAAGPQSRMRHAASCPTLCLALALQCTLHLPTLLRARVPQLSAHPRRLCCVPLRLDFHLFGTVLMLVTRNGTSSSEPPFHNELPCGSQMVRRQRPSRTPLAHRTRHNHLNGLGRGVPSSFEPAGSHSMAAGQDRRDGVWTKCSGRFGWPARPKPPCAPNDLDAQRCLHLQKFACERFRSKRLKAPTQQNKQRAPRV